MIQTKRKKGKVLDFMNVKMKKPLLEKKEKEIGDKLKEVEKTEEIITGVYSDIEDFKKFRVKDLVVILVLSILYFILAYLMQGSGLAFILDLVLFSFLLSFSVCLIKKMGTGVVFSFFASLLSKNVNNLDILGNEKIFIFVLMGLIFEIVFLILKLEVRLLPLDVILGSGVMVAFLPLAAGLIMGTSVLKSLWINVINIVILNFFIGVGGSVLGFLIWYSLKNKKFVLKFEYF